MKNHAANERLTWYHLPSLVSMFLYDNLDFNNLINTENNTLTLK